VVELPWAADSCPWVGSHPRAGCVHPRQKANRTVRVWHRGERACAGCSIMRHQPAACGMQHAAPRAHRHAHRDGGAAGRRLPRAHHHVLDAARRGADERDGRVALHHHALARIPAQRLRPPPPATRLSKRQVERPHGGELWRQGRPRGAPVSAHPPAGWAWTPPPSPESVHALARFSSTGRRFTLL
jgi:hypothetical protein